MMKLSFQSSYISIQSLEAVTIPDFCLITGRNGCGKTHLLRAIANGFVQNNVASVPQGQNSVLVRYIDCSNLVPADGGMVASETLRNEKTNLAQNFQSIISQTNSLEPARASVRALGINDANYLNSPHKLLAISPEILREEFGLSDPVASIREIQRLLDEAKQNISMHFQPIVFKELEKTAVLKKTPLISLTHSEILASNINTWGQTDIFSNSFNRQFTAYRDLALDNDYQSFRNAERNESNIVLSEAQFVDAYGNPPWELANMALREANLDFEISAPDASRYNQYRPVLKKISTGAEVDFQNLSSGEKVLVCLAFCIYQTGIDKESIIIPKILLLDEIDSPLHPSMSRSVLNVIQKAFVDNFGIKVIATTHSPATVALAPNDCIFTMDSAQGALSKISKTQALDLLTEDVPTLSLHFEGRRQIFVESPADAKTYDALYQLYKSYLNSERSLHFVATGTGSANSGCDIVKQVVSNLVSSGNSSVFGLLDWDGRNKAADRIAILAYGKRNGLENLLFDPFLIAAAITRDFRAENTKVGIAGNYTLRDFANCSLDEKQRAVDVITATILGRTSNRDVACDYESGIKLLQDRAFLEGDDHEMEERLMQAFPFFRSISKNQAGLFLQYIVEKILFEYPDIVPVEVRQVFSELLSKSSHQIA